jgi:hypothetical protein
MSAEAMSLRITCFCCRNLAPRYIPIIIDISRTGATWLTEASFIADSAAASPRGFVV